MRNLIYKLKSRLFYYLYRKRYGDYGPSWSSDSFKLQNLIKLLINLNMKREISYEAKVEILAILATILILLVGLSIGLLVI